MAVDSAADGPFCEFERGGDVGLFDPSTDQKGLYFSVHIERPFVGVVSHTSSTNKYRIILCLST